MGHVVSILFLTILQVVVGYLWYSKYLFGKVFMSELTRRKDKVNKDDMKSSMRKMFIATLAKSVTIYFITYYTFFLLPQTFFIIIIFIVLLIVIVMYDEHVWQDKTLVMYAINASQVAVSIILAFTLALVLVSY